MIQAETTTGKDLDEILFSLNEICGTVEEDGAVPLLNTDQLWGLIVAVGEEYLRVQRKMSSEYPISKSGRPLGSAHYRSSTRELVQREQTLKRLIGLLPEDSLEKETTLRGWVQ